MQHWTIGTRIWALLGASWLLGVFASLRPVIGGDPWVFGSAVAILFAALLGYSITTVGSLSRMLRSCASQLGESALQVASASKQVATSNDLVARGSTKQAAALQQAAASMEQMTEATKRNTGNSTEVTAMLTETVAQVDRSNKALGEMTASMNAIKLSSEKVAKINKTIDEIAFQTNILALNAAVEAARAGAAGLGFAVVADEVRNLAHRSASAAKDTAVLIEQSIANSKQGAARLEQVAVSIRAVTGSAGKVKKLMSEVSESGRQQIQGVGQTSTVISQMGKATQAAAHGAGKTAAAAEELKRESGVVSNLVRQLGAMVDGGSGIPISDPGPSSAKIANGFSALAVPMALVLLLTRTQVAQDTAPLVSAKSELVYEPPVASRAPDPPVSRPVAAIEPPKNTAVYRPRPRMTTHRESGFVPGIATKVYNAQTASDLFRYRMGLYWGDLPKNKPQLAMVRALTVNF